MSERSLRVLKLVAENVKRLSVVEIIPGDNPLVLIGGKNGAGKTSVIDSIAYVLGGERLVPSEPIRAGESEAKITADLDEFIVIRKFSRRREMLCGPIPDDVPHVHDSSCPSKWGETTSTLSITNREGAKYPSPQAMLDKLLGKLSFDPLAFSRESSKKQNEILRQLTKLDFSMLDSQRTSASERRAMHKKSLTIAEGERAKMPTYADAPAEVISIEEISAEVRKADDLRNAAETASIAVEAAKKFLEANDNEQRAAKEGIQRLEAELKRAKDHLQFLTNTGETKTAETQLLVTAAEEAKKLVPNFEELDKRLREIDLTNGKVRANIIAADRDKEVKRLEGLVATEDARVKEIDLSKAQMLEAAKFPIPGLGLTDDGVTFEGLPLEQVSSSVQLRVSVAIGLALNSSIKVLLIRNGNLLDDDSLKIVSGMAAESGAQVWMEYVTASGDGMTVMMEDGHVKA